MSNFALSTDLTMCFVFPGANDDKTVICKDGSCFKKRPDNQAPPKPVPKSSWHSPPKSIFKPAVEVSCSFCLFAAKIDGLVQDCSYALSHQNVLIEQIICMHIYAYFMGHAYTWTCITDISGLVEDCSISSADALEILLSFTKPLM